MAEDGQLNRLASEVQLSPDVVVREVGDETILLNLASGTYYGLDPVGARFLSLIEQGHSPMQARDALLKLYEVGPAVLDRDLAALLDDLFLNGIVKAEN